MHRRATSLLLGLLSLSSLATQAQQLNTTKLDSLLTSLAAHNKLMGSLALAHDGKVVYRRAFGYQQLDGATKTPATTATRYRVGSVSKMFTATMIFQLIDEKKLALSTPLATFFPQLPNAQAITIDQLLSHHSGLHSFTSDAAYPGYMRQPQTQAQLLTYIGQAKPEFEPGVKAAYSNSNFVVLGYIVEKLTKLSYAQALQKRIVAKAGLKDTYYGGKITFQKQEAFSYTAGASGWQLAPETDMSIPGGAGAVVSTPTDLTRFLAALFGGRLVSAASLESMKTIRNGYGRGLFQGKIDGRESYGHGGVIDGFQSNVGYFPESNLFVALTANAQAFPLDDALRGVLRIYSNQPYPLPTFQASFVPAPADLARYVGTYVCAQLLFKLTMTQESTTLRGEATDRGSLLLEPVQTGVFKFDPAGIRIEFDTAKPTFTLQQGGTFVFTKE